MAKAIYPTTKMPHRPPAIVLRIDLGLMINPATAPPAAASNKVLIKKYLNATLACFSDLENISFFDTELSASLSTLSTDTFSILALALTGARWVLAEIVPRGGREISVLPISAGTTLISTAVPSMSYAVLPNKMTASSANTDAVRISKLITR